MLKHDSNKLGAPPVLGRLTSPIQFWSDPNSWASQIDRPTLASRAQCERREIAELCEKRHDHVLRDIEKMLTEISAPKFGVADFEAEYRDEHGKARKEYRLPKDLTVTLITGYCADLRYKVVNRLADGG